MKKEKLEKSCKIMYFLWALQKIWGHAFRVHKTDITCVTFFQTLVYLTTELILGKYTISFFTLLCKRSHVIFSDVHLLSTCCSLLPFTTESPSTHSIYFCVFTRQRLKRCSRKDNRKLFKHVLNTSWL